jgi:hypothetical protein
MPIPMPLAMAQVTAPAQDASESPGWGGSCPMAAFQPQVSNRWVAMVVTAPTPATYKRQVSVSGTAMGGSFGQCSRFRLREVIFLGVRWRWVVDAAVDLVGSRVTR